MSMVVSEAPKTQVPLARFAAVAVLGGTIGATAALLNAEYAIVALSASTALVSLLWMHYLVSVFSIRRLTIPAAFYWAYFLRVYLPAHVIFLEGDRPAKWLYMLGVLAVLVLVPLGIALAQVVFRRDRRDSRRFFDSITWSTIVSQRAASVWFVSMFVLSVVVIALHLSRLPVIPIVQLVRNPGQAATITALRESTLKTLAAPSWLRYLIAWTRDLFLPLLVMLCWGEYRVTRKKKWLGRGLVVLCLGLFYASLTLAKGPVAQFLLMLVLYYWIWSDTRFSLRLLLLSVAFVLLFPFVVNFQKYGMGFTLTDTVAGFSGLTYPSP